MDCTTPEQTNESKAPRKRGRPFKRGERSNDGRFVPSVYRCTYCRKRIVGISKLPGHEAQCDARFVVRRMWLQQNDRLKRSLLNPEGL
jgi:hypothetical protein